MRLWYMLKLIVEAIPLFFAFDLPCIIFEARDSSQLYCAAGNTVHSFDIRLVSLDRLAHPQIVGKGLRNRELQKYDHNTDEINQVALNRNATYMAAADDSGEIKAEDLVREVTIAENQMIYVHALTFLPDMQRRSVSSAKAVGSYIRRFGFQNCKMGYFKGETAEDSRPCVGQMCNPPFVHALATHGDSSGEMGRLLAVARGDGAVEVYDLGFQSETPTKVKGLKSGRSTTTNADGERKELALKSGLQCRLSADNGGHLTAVSSVVDSGQNYTGTGLETFARFGERGRYLLSGGNDGLIKLWDWASSNFEGTMAVEGAPLTLSIHHGKKINWLSTIDNNRVNIAVADTSKVLSLYHVL
ncbi:hypothetical protein AXG93_2278s1130 [Marchantia polymorpha subsp. ruderalis]|uniref:Anaphase-promoting complex subunit 4 WD40 domain-containing protein n=1 Tax=Marchantia polymorpha subsp. ruderalis TaxID=1480154 RepID=A0A176WGL7_MARPO|nr:hypothetical protein AXG93_2278s1130 [Marchantia polymorpha subsp. ruderalis]